jgi:hypothetical protein
MLRRILITLALVLSISGAAYAWLWWHASPSPKGDAYVCMDGTPLWNGVGQVRSRLQKLPWGARVTVLGNYGGSVQVRTGKGITGWVNEDDLIDPGVWQRLGKLAARVRRMTAQAPGHTRVLSNLRLDPGRTSPRVGQLRRNTPVGVLARGVATWDGGPGGRPRKEDWLLVRAHLPGGAEIAGWALGSFIEEDLPQPLPAYASSAGVDPVAFFPLRKVNDPRAGVKPNYLLAGVAGPQGGPCDFTKVSVYTWSVTHQQYATAFVRSDLCGRLPIDVKFVNDARQDVLFSFENLDPRGDKTLTFRMRSTMVRLLRSQPTPAKP